MLNWWVRKYLQFYGQKSCLSRPVISNSFFFLSFSGLPDPFAKVSVDGSGQCYSTEVCKNTLDPKWNQHYDL